MESNRKNPSELAWKKMARYCSAKREYENGEEREGIDKRGGTLRGRRKHFDSIECQQENI